MTDGFTVFLIYFATVAVLLRMRRHSPAVIATGTALAVYPIGLIGLLAFKGGVEFWSYSTTFWFLALCFLMVFGAIYKSVSLRLMLDLLDRPSGRADRDELFRHYIGDRSYKDRIEVARTNRLAAETPDGYKLTERGRALAGAIALVQDLFSIRVSG